MKVLRLKSLFHPAAVYRSGDVVIRDAGPWTPTVHKLLRHFEDVGFAGATRIVDSGFDAQGRETLSYVEGEFTHPARGHLMETRLCGLHCRVHDP
jgi:hypothetical protein